MVSDNNHVFRICAISLLFIAITSCSLKGLVIPNATYFVASHIGDKYDFYYNQEKEFKRGLDDIFKANIEGLKKLKSDVAQINIKEYELHEKIHLLGPLYYRVANQVNELLAKTFSEFKPDQVENLYKVMEEDNETILNRSRKDKTDEIAKRFEFFFHHVTEKQKELIKKNIAIFQAVNKIRLKNRLITQDGLKEAYKSADNSKRKESIKKVFDENLKNREPITNLMPVAKFCSEFFKTLDKDQVEFFNRRKKLILDWIEGFIQHYKN